MRRLPKTRLGDGIWSFIRFYGRHHRLPSKRPLFNDVLHKIKTGDEILDPLRVFVTDKESLKTYVRDVVGDRYNVPTIDVIRSAEGVDGYGFPDDCCIKPTHASGQVILRRGGEAVDVARIKGWFGLDYYLVDREANYRDLTPKVIVEPLVFENANVEDYKFFCFNGLPRFVQVDIDRYVDHKRKFFDVDWNELDFSITYPKSEAFIGKPGNLTEMLAVASKLSAACSLVRVDRYSDGETTLVGEITNCSDSARGRFLPAAAEKQISDLLFD